MNQKPKRVNFNPSAVIIAALVSLIIPACASVDPEPIRKNLAQTELTIDQAEGSGANQYAPLNLKRAEEKLNEARNAFEDENYEQADFLAEQALVEARLALAKSETQKTENIVEELQSSISQLRREIEQNKSSQQPK